MSDLDIPAFLLIAPGERQASWKGRRLTNSHAGGERQHPWHLPRHMDATCWQFQRELEAKREQKKQEGLAALRAWKEANKR
jgi:hypothetical protein